MNGYIADMERCYQGNYYYIFPDISGDSDLMNGIEYTDGMMVNAQGMELQIRNRDTITTTSFMTTSSNGYAVTEDSQEKALMYSVQLQRRQLKARMSQIRMRRIPIPKQRP